MAGKFRKWALTSPDGIGDFLFRIPWLRAMEEAGWTLLLIGQAPVLEVARLAGLRFQGHELSENPYGKRVKISRVPFRSEIRTICNFAPDRIVFGPSHPTFLEEVLSESRLPGETWGFFVQGGPWFSESLKSPEAIARRFSHRVAIQASDPEPVRNAKAAMAMLGVPLHDRAFLFPEGSFPKSARSKGRVAVCAGRREGDYFTGWGEENWIPALRQLEATGLRFVFVGGHREAASHACIAQGLREPATHLDLTGKIPFVSGLLEILNGADAFVGKDGGILHLSAALGKPVVGVFGGGHWGRFLPHGTRAAVLSVKTPCRGCDWRCHLPRHLCVAGLAPGRLLEAWIHVSSPGPKDTLIMEEDLSPAHTEELILESHKKYPAMAHELKRSGERTLRGIHRLPWPLSAWIQKTLFDE